MKTLLGNNYYNYSDVYERYFDLHYFASASKLKNTNTGNQVVLISNMVFYETNKVIGLSQEEWYKNLTLKSFKIVKKLPASDNTNLAYVLEKHIRDKQREPQAKNARGGSSSVNKNDLIIQYFIDASRSFKLKQTRNKKNNVYFYDLIIDENKTYFEESIVQDDFLVMVDDERVLYLDKKRKSFKGFYINENGVKRDIKFTKVSP